MFLLGDWHLRTSTAIAKVGSLKSCPAKGLDLNKLGAPRSNDPLIRTNFSFGGMREQQFENMMQVCQETGLST